MSHAAYLFLMDLDIAGTSDDECMLGADARLHEAFHERLDDNNWTRPIGLMPNDRPIILPGDDDRRSAHDLIDEQNRVAEIFRDKIAESWAYNSSEFTLQNEHIDWSDLPTHDHKAARKGFVERVLRYEAALRADPGICRIKDNPRYLAYTLKHLKAYATCARTCRIGGFTRSKSATPYIWRCFDVRTSPETAPNAIYFVDIHT